MMKPLVFCLSQPALVTTSEKRVLSALSKSIAGQQGLPRRAPSRAPPPGVPACRQAGILPLGGIAAWFDELTTLRTTLSEVEGSPAARKAAFRQSSTVLERY